ncbi:hypothetical protein IE53DRAFT_364211 [Violaceomyces palustris]|uniref:Uncharacterized protein n=1 Tax=Violaceomyces palustris TaxID=1673888 RepID=A0ACD0NQG9_9BASI|nr:hypothetical protein IE53DRAFT_364211 [Violaceomyces palustris]
MVRLWKISILQLVAMSLSLSNFPTSFVDALPVDEGTQLVPNRSITLHCTDFRKGSVRSKLSKRAIKFRPSSSSSDPRMRWKWYHGLHDLKGLLFRGWKKGRVTKASKNVATNPPTSLSPSLASKKLSKFWRKVNPMSAPRGAFGSEKWVGFKQGAARAERRTRGATASQLDLRPLFGKRRKEERMIRLTPEFERMLYSDSDLEELEEGGVEVKVEVSKAAVKGPAKGSFKWRQWLKGGKGSNQG